LLLDVRSEQMKRTSEGIGVRIIEQSEQIRDFRLECRELSLHAIRPTGELDHRDPAASPA
jgi:hypothetical protein